MKPQGYIPDAVDHAWIASIGKPIGPVFEAIEAAAISPRVPILDREAGRVLQILAQGRRRIVEIGTAFGYSTLWMASGMPADGHIVTIDPDRSRTERARAWWHEAGFAEEAITVVNAPALDAFAANDPRLAGPFDLAFIDALKPEYPEYLARLLPRLAPDALVTADNVLQGGRVARPAEHPAGAPQMVRAFDEAILADARLNATILPLGDGLLVAARVPGIG